MATIRSQADQRRGAKYTDQHGRPWYAEVEKSTGDACTPFQPQFIAPILPPKKYVRADPDVPGRVTVFYAEWIGHLQTRDREWFREAQLIGASEHKEHFNPDAPFSQTILNKMGDRPRVGRTKTPPLSPVGDAALPAIAAMQGNRWILGLKGPNGETPRMPARLEAFFAKPVDTIIPFTDEFEEPVPIELEPAVPEKRKPGRPRKEPVAVGASDIDWAKE